jgi:P27 family predicted phage terminase small subunit
MPRTKKAAGQAVDQRNGRRAELTVDAAGQLERFELPPRRPAWLKESHLAWAGAWADGVAAMWTPADRPILLRWIDSVDRAARSLHRGDRKPVVVGGNGQITEHPSYGTAKAALATAERCEAQLGFGALNRNRLGLTMAAAQKSLLDLNEAFLEGADDEPDARLG